MTRFLAYSAAVFLSFLFVFALSYWLVLPAPGFLATYALSHFIYCFAIPYTVMRRRGVVLATFVGWLACLASGVTWEYLYRSLFTHFHWLKPGLPGEVLYGLLFGWAPSWGFAVAILKIHEKRAELHGSSFPSAAKAQPFDPHEPCEGPRSPR